MKKRLFLASLVTAALLITGTAWAGGQEEGGGVTATATVASGTYNEAPMLAKMVSSGELPPVDDRLPVEPMVLEVAEIGNYGGTFFVFATNNSPWNDLTEEPSRGPTLLRMGVDGKIGPDVAKDYLLAPDNMSLTLFLREGMKWSDGAPYTAHDFTFKFYDMFKQDEVETWGIRSQIDNVVAVDDYTVRYEFNRPFPAFLLDMVHWRSTDWMLYSPKHYLSKYHIAYNEDANTLAKEEGFETWGEAFNNHASFRPTHDINRPRVDPWMFTEQTTTIRAFVRNPFFHQVDQAGNQLPYADRIVSELVEKETYDLKIIAGEADIAFLSATLDNYTLYKQNEAAGNYVVKLIPGVEGNEASYGFNLNHPDPVRRELYNNIKFRQAMSLGIDRDEVNRVAFSGFATPRQASVLPGTSYYKAEWAEDNPYTQYDPDEANRMLDELGLARGSDGLRRDSEGRTMLLTIEYSSIIHQGIALAHELVKEFWEDLGFEVQVKEVGGNIWGERRRSPDTDVISGPVHGIEMYTFLSRYTFGFSVRAPLWWLWLDANDRIESGLATLDDFEGGVLPGEEPPDEIKEMVTMGRNRINLVYNSEEYLDASSQYLQWLSDNLFTIGTVGMSPMVFIARPNVGNTPEVPHPWFEETLNLNYFAAQFFYK